MQILTSVLKLLYAVSEWSGPLVAGALAAMMSLGEEGYLQNTSKIMEGIQETRGRVKANLGPIKGGLAPIYGAVGKMPDRGTVNELLVDASSSVELSFVHSQPHCFSILANIS
ncbi:Uncharacterized protein Rs2_02275 [Raphanus sativus]|nr:Uncharacterized protein Rs2_02275 [Raphanus sativus]